MRANDKFMRYRRHFSFIQMNWVDIGQEWVWKA